MNPVLWLALGALSGFVSRLLLNCRASSVWLDIATGVVGAALGGFIAVRLGLSPITQLNLYSLLVAVGGSCLLLLLAGWLRRMLRSR